MFFKAQIVVGLGFAMPSTAKIRVLKVNVQEQSIRREEDMAAVETSITIIVNGKHKIMLFCLPRQLKQLAVGWLMSEAIIRSPQEITGIEVRRNCVRVECDRKAENRLRLAAIREPIDSACGSIRANFVFLKDRRNRPFCRSRYRIRVEDLFRFVRVLNLNAKVFKQTGGTHSAAISEGGKLVAFAEDIGRHNAVDKVIGAAALKQSDFSRCVIVSSGRQPANMVLKAARVGVPIIASIASPISSGVIAARKTGVTLACFVREPRMNVYSHPERIEVSEARCSK